MSLRGRAGAFCPWLASPTEAADAFADNLKVPPALCQGRILVSPSAQNALWCRATLPFGTCRKFFDIKGLAAA